MQLPYIANFPGWATHCNHSLYSFRNPKPMHPVHCCICLSTLGYFKHQAQHVRCGWCLQYQGWIDVHMTGLITVVSIFMKQKTYSRSSNGGLHMQPRACLQSHHEGSAVGVARTTVS